MKKISPLLLVLLTFSTLANSQPLTVDQFDWLLGNWKRTNEKPDRSTVESWQKQNDTLYLGISFTIKAQDTIWQENVRLHRTNSAWYYDVTAKGDKKPTSFKLTAFDIKSLICENERNEFPKKIAYRRDGKKLSAVISGGGDKILFNFTKIKNLSPTNH